MRGFNGRGVGLRGRVRSADPVGPLGQIPCKLQCLMLLRPSTALALTLQLSPALALTLQLSPALALTLQLSPALALTLQPSPALALTLQLSPALALTLQLSPALALTLQLSAALALTLQLSEARTAQAWTQVARALLRGDLPPCVSKHSGGWELCRVLGRALQDQGGILRRGDKAQLAC